MRKNHSDSGFLAIEALGALLILAILIPVLNNLWKIGTDNIRKRAVAEHFMTVQKAAGLYGKQFHATLMPAVTETSGPGISFAALKTAKCLPERFQDTNAWGQTYNIFARKDKTGDLAIVVVTTGGRGASTTDPSFANVTVPETAALARAGYVPTGLIGNGSVLRGAYGAWEITLASLGVSATAGHLGGISTLNSSELGQDFLYRVAVPGEPQLNAMSTALDMTNHDIRGVQDLQYVPRPYAVDFCTSSDDEGRTFLDAEAGLYLCRNGKAELIGDSGNSLHLREAQLASHGQRITKPICAAGTNTHPEIFVAPSIVSSAADSKTMASIQAWAVNLSATEWQVRMRVLGADNQWTYPAANYGKLLVFTTCAKD